MTGRLRQTMGSGDQPAVPAPAAAALAAYVLVTIGSCLRGDVLLILGVPLTAAGFAVAWLPAAGARFQIFSRSPVPGSYSLLRVDKRRQAPSCST